MHWAAVTVSWSLQRRFLLREKFTICRSWKSSRPARIASWEEKHGRQSVTISCLLQMRSTRFTIRWWKTEPSRQDSLAMRIMWSLVITVWTATVMTRKWSKISGNRWKNTLSRLPINYMSSADSVLVWRNFPISIQMSISRMEILRRLEHRRRSLRQDRKCTVNCLRRQRNFLILWWRTNFLTCSEEKQSVRAAIWPIFQISSLRLFLQTSTEQAEMWTSSPMNVAMHSRDIC